MMLLHKSLCVCEITNVLQLSTATVSNHLSYLRENGFIEDNKDGKWINYSINRDSSDSMVKTIIERLPIWFTEDEIIKSDLSKVQSVDRYCLK